MATDKKAPIITTAKTVTKSQSMIPTGDLAFGKENYTLMLIGLAIIIIGFALMSGGKMEDPSAFNPEIFSFRRITLAPIVVMIGFVIEVVAIVKKSKE